MCVHSCYPGSFLKFVTMKKMLALTWLLHWNINNISVVMYASIHVMLYLLLSLSVTLRMLFGTCIFLYIGASEWGCNGPVVKRTHG